MTWGEYIDFETMEAKAEARKEGHAEGKEQGLAEGRAEAALATYRENILEVLNELGAIPDDVVKKVNSVTDIDVLKQWFTLAIKSDSMASFLSQIN